MKNPKPEIQISGFSFMPTIDFHKIRIEGASKPARIKVGFIVKCQH